MTNRKKYVIIYKLDKAYADVAELADALVSGSSEAIHVGSSPVVRTKKGYKKDIAAKSLDFSRLFCFSALFSHSHEKKILNTYGI